jgi:hypothetical protein
LRLYECDTQQCPQSRGIELVHIVDLTDSNTEVVTRFNTNISSSGRFFTDSNGLGIFLTIIPYHVIVISCYFISCYLLNVVDYTMK